VNPATPLPELAQWLPALVSIVSAAIMVGVFMQTVKQLVRGQERLDEDKVDKEVHERDVANLSDRINANGIEINNLKQREWTRHGRPN